MNGNIVDIVIKTIYLKPGPLKQNISITQLHILQNINGLHLLENINQATSKEDKYFSSFVMKKSSPKLPLNIVLKDYFAINNGSISDDSMKWEQPKTSTVKLKYIRLASKEFI